jgi:hypothetical protein
MEPLGRPKKQPRFEPPGFRQAVRAQFIEFGRHHNSRALHLLGTKVWRQEMSLQDWAKLFYVSNTWVEEWARGTLESWRGGGYGAPVTSESGDVDMWYLPPKDGRTDADTFTCTLEATPRARLEFGATIGGDSTVWFNVGEDDETAFRRYMHSRLDAALDDFFKRAVEVGASRRIYIPSDLNLKIECAALYVLCQQSKDELVKGLQSNHVSAPTIYGWLKEAMELLELKMRPAGHRVVNHLKT